MDAQTLAEVMGHRVSQARYAELAPAFNKALLEAECTNVRRAAQFIAQIGHESGGLYWMEEAGTGDDYNGRADLGNIHPGDGPRYKGRGPIQITGRSNYRTLSRWAHSKGLVPTSSFFEDEPHRLSEPDYGFLGAVWYWTVARPRINQMADNSDTVGVTRAVNGGTNGLQDRHNRYQHALQFGKKILPQQEVEVKEKILPYARDQITQDTFYNCGPASVQTVVRAATGHLFTEAELAQKLKTTVRGTDYIGLFPPALHHYIPQAQYVVREMPNDPPTHGQTALLWDNLTHSLDAGYGAICNIVAPPNNYPKAQLGGESPHYSGGTVYHYFAVMGYREDVTGRYLWVADSGFYPYGYWITLQQLATLIPPKGYTYSTAPKRAEGNLMEPVLLGGVSAGALDEAKIAAKETARILGEPIQSLVSPHAKMTPIQALQYIDRATWDVRILLLELFRQLGMDPQKIINDAYAAEEKRTAPKEEA